MSVSESAEQRTLNKLRARHDQLLQERQQNLQRLEGTRQQLRALEEAEVGYRYVIGELERQIQEVLQEILPMSAEEALDGEAKAPAESDMETSTLAQRTRTIKPRSSRRRS